jgi:hypothetical protein
MYRSMNLDPYLTACINTNSKKSPALNVKPKVRKLVETA